MLLGIVAALIGAVLWHHQPLIDINPLIILSIILLLFGAINILHNVVNLLSTSKIQNIPLIKNPSLYHNIYIFILIFLGSVAYTFASYYHLKMNNWTFTKALLIAIPIVLIEYQFSLRGNFLASTILSMNAVQIALITMTFYFINTWLLNYFLLKHPIVWWREILAFTLIILAFVVTTNIAR